MRKFFNRYENINVGNNSFFLVENGFNPIREREIETFFAISNGYMGTRASLAEFSSISNPGTFVSGVYSYYPDEPFNELVVIPDWTRIQVFIDDEIINIYETEYENQRRIIDMKQGMAFREWTSIDNRGRKTNIKIINLISSANKYEAFKSISLCAENYSGVIKVKSGIDISLTNRAGLLVKPVLHEDFIAFAMRLKKSARMIAVGQKGRFEDKYINVVYDKSFKNEILQEEWQWKALENKEYFINSMVVTYTNLETLKPLSTAKDHLKSVFANNIEKRIDYHLLQWEEFWESVAICIVGDNDAQRFVNFAMYHLYSAGKFNGEYSSIGARALTGEAYKGHIFWDTEIYVLPFFIFTVPHIAKKLLMYRYNTLEAARVNAIKEGLKGASFAWESTDTGVEMTPEEVTLLNGEKIEILSGKYEHHISPDIAYSVWKYWQATEDKHFMLNYGAEIIFETARFCYSLLSKEEDGLYHIKNVIGPDEYHEMIDDDCYTNILVQYNLQIALKTYDLFAENQEQFENLSKKIKLTKNELSLWSKASDNIYIAFNSDTKIFEQFKGYFNLEFIDLEDFKTRLGPMDIILGRERVKNSQIIKQPDVLMFLFLLADRFSEDIIQANFEYYDKRTGHGSSLSPGIHSIMASKSGNVELAYNYFVQTADIDLGDNMGNASGGIHIASQGSLWMSIVMGFAGMCICDSGIIFNPHLPEKWDSLDFSIIYKNQKLKISINSNEISFCVIGATEIRISIGYDNWKIIKPDRKYYAYKNNKWYWK